MGREDEDIRNIRENLAGMNRGPIAELWDKVVALWDLITEEGLGGQGDRDRRAGLPGLAVRRGAGLHTGRGTARRCRRHSRGGGRIGCGIGKGGRRCVAS